jgi:hypothetical protein
MAQEQSEVELVFRNGRRGVAVATGNSASWACSCEALLIGRTGAPGGATNRTRVQCPNCERNYLVVPRGRVAGTRVSRVEEIEWPPQA